MLQARSIAWCSADVDEEAEPSVEQTARDFVYLRLRRSAYDPRSLDAWAARLLPFLERGTDVYLYFKHEDDPCGVEYARFLLRRLMVVESEPS
jgi:uncharacterized protein YecE (DUF72 family)